MPHTLPALPYAATALEPHIDARTMEIHHGKHHQTYITNLNNALAGKADLEAKSIEDLISNLEDPKAIDLMQPRVEDQQDRVVPQTPRPANNRVLDPPPDDMPTGADPIDYSGSSSSSTPAPSPAPPANETPQQRERRLANEAWLRRVPDDPGSLLREKFRLEHERRQLGGSLEQ